MTNKEKAIIIAKKNHQIYDDYYDSMQECIESAIQMAEWKDEQAIASLGGWSSEEPNFDCFCLVKTPEFPKNCECVVAEWDNDAKCFYLESNDMPIETWDKWKLIEKQTI